MLNKNEINKFFVEINKNPSFVDMVLALEDPDKILLAMEEEGISLSLDDLLAIRDIMEENLLHKKKNELSDSDLSQVSGGAAIFPQTASSPLNLERLFIMINRISSTIMSQTEQKVLQKDSSLSGIFRKGR